MKCRNCGKDLKLERFISRCGCCHEIIDERFVYECKNCGILDNPRPNIDYETIKRRKLEQIYNDLDSFNLKIECEEVHDYLMKHPNPFLIISLFSKMGKRVIRKEDLNFTGVCL